MKRLTVPLIAIALIAAAYIMHLQKGSDATEPAADRPSPPTEVEPLSALQKKDGREGSGEVSIPDSIAPLVTVEPEPEPEIALLVGAQRKANDALVADLGEKLDMNDVQLVALQKVHAQRLDELTELVGDWDGEGGEALPKLRKMKEVGALMRGAGLREDLRDILTEDQLKAFDADQKKVWDREVESRAYKDLAKINRVLELSEEQKDEVFALLHEDAGENLEADQDLVAFLSRTSAMLETPGNGDQGGDHIDMIKMLSQMPEYGGENQDGQDEQTYLAEFEQRETAEIEERVERFAQVLDEAQLDRYRQHLDSSNQVLNMVRARRPQP